MAPIRSCLLLTATAVASASSAAPLNICGTNATLGAAVLSVLNLTYPGLSAVAAAASIGDLNGACEALSSYYSSSNSSAWLRLPFIPPSSSLAGGYADAMLFNDSFYLSGVDVTAVIPRNSDGGLDWLDHGPRGDPEFMNCLNRHNSFDYLLSAYNATGNGRYAEYFNSLVVDWVTHLPCPHAMNDSNPPCVPLGVTPGTVCSWSSATPQSCSTGTMESPWRSLEMGIRLGSTWPQAFFGFQNASNFTVSGRVLFVLGVGQHNEALDVDGGHAGSGTPNWEMTQWQGLVSSTTCFPELHNATGLRVRALGYLEALLKSGVYPDGVETEQASGYDMGTAGDYLNTLLLLRQGGVPPPSPSFTSLVEEMWNYGAYVADPCGCLPRNGDSDLCGSGYNAVATDYFNRSDWTYVRSNGAQGTPPAWLPTQGPSSVFPWAGQVVLRSGFDANATWVWFDVGPYGSSGHAHRDKLQLVLHARGSMMLADSGRFAYAGTDLSNTLHTQYAGYTRAHNTLTIDGCDQLPLPAVASEPVPTTSYSLSPDADYAYGSMSLYSGLKGNATHTRGVFFSRPAAQSSGDDGDWVVVVDVLNSSQPRSLQASWHTHPNATGVTVDAATGVALVPGVRAATGQPTGAQVCVIPAPPSAWNLAWDTVSVVRGQVRNDSAGLPWQGWYSQAYDDAWPASTLLYDAAVPATARFAWLLVPTGGPAPCNASITVTSANATAVQVLVQLDAGQPAQQVTVPLGG